MSGAAPYLDMSASDANDLLLRHAPLVKRIAYHLMGRLPASVQADDLIQAGMIGLLDAVHHYDASQGANFETYAGIRIRGAMLDEIRKNDWVPRSVHRKARAAAQALREIENRTGRDAHDQEVAAELGITLQEYHRILQDSNGAKVFSLEEISEEQEEAIHNLAGVPGPLEGLQAEDFKRCLAQAVAALPERERLVLSLYYDDELNLREIGEVLGVSESRVSQIHAQAVIRLQARMQDWIGR